MDEDPKQSALMDTYLAAKDLEEKAGRSFRVEGTHETSYHAGRESAFREVRVALRERLIALGLGPWLKSVDKA